MLLTDSGAVVVSDLQSYEGNIQDVATANKIDLDAKIAQATREIRIELQSHLQKASNVSNFDPTRVISQYLGNEAVSTRMRSNQIFLSDALKLWLIYRALTLAFADAWATKRNDKYQQKYTNYEERTKRVRGWFFSEGVPIVSNPLPKPDKPALSQAGAGGLAARSYQIQVTWVDASSKESAPSDTVSISASANNLVTVDITALLPPSGATLRAGQTPLTLGTATQWNVYASSNPTGLLTKQATVDIGTKGWTEPTAGLTSIGTVVGSGQDPDVYRGVQNTVMRG